jgi:IclR family acetate operon transcriptional repressor
LAKLAKRTAPRLRSNRNVNRATERSGNVQALTRALMILNILAEHEGGLSLTEVARTAGLAPSTSHRLLTTLQQERFVGFDRELTRWLVGVRAFTVGNAFLHSRDLVRAARPYLERLMEETAETANLAIEDEGMAVYLGQVQSRQLMRAIAKPGGRVFMHSSAVGKAILAALSPAKAAKITQQCGLPVFTPRTIHDPRRLLRQLEEIHRRGFAVDDEEYAVGLRCVAAAVLDEDGIPLGAVSVSGPTVRVTRERVSELGAAVCQVVDELTAELGGRRAAVAPQKSFVRASDDFSTIRKRRTATTMPE